MNLEEFSPELMEKAKACTTPEELATLAETQGVKLTDDQLENLSGGADCEKHATEWANVSSK